MVVLGTKSRCALTDKKQNKARQAVSCYGVPSLTYAEGIIPLYDRSTTSTDSFAHFPRPFRHHDTLATTVALETVPGTTACKLADF